MTQQREWKNYYQSPSRRELLRKLGSPYYDPNNIPNQDGLIFYAYIDGVDLACTVLKDAKTGYHYVYDNRDGARVEWKTIQAWRYELTPETKIPKPTKPFELSLYAPDAYRPGYRVDLHQGRSSRWHRVYGE